MKADSAIATAKEGAEQTTDLPTISAANSIKERAAHFDLRSEEAGRRAKEAFRELRIASRGIRDGALLALAELLEMPQIREQIHTANERDIEAAQDLPVSLVDRLRLTERRIDDMASALREIVALPDPVGELLRGYTLGNGIRLRQERAPLGVIFTIYESRPNVTVDVGALCIKSANCAILRGGKEALHSNQKLFSLFQQALKSVGLPQESIQFISDPDRAYMLSLLRQERYIDLVVPRGGEQLIQFITRHSHIPVVKHDKGLCNLYVDQSADLEQAIRLAINAKLQRPSVCNSIENLLLHKNFPKIAELLEALDKAGARLLGNSEAAAYHPSVAEIAPQQEEEEYSTEYLDNRLAVRIVKGKEEAADFIFRYGSGHSETIAARDVEAIRYFRKAIDCAALFINCSSRFHDGGQMGLGAEVGISTTRLHARGPMALSDLTTTTYTLEGEGQIRE